MIARFLTLFLVLSPAVSSSLRAQENRYDLLSRTLTPFLTVFAKTTKSPNRAMAFTLKLEQMTDLAPALAARAVQLDPIVTRSRR